MRRDFAFTTSDGLRLVGDIDGDGARPLVLLLHGGGQTRHAWAGAVDRLFGEGFDVVRYDARGHGDSDWAGDSDYQTKTHARDVAEALKVLGRPAALVGASMGGVSGLIATATAPSQVSALVLVDIVPRFAVEGVERVRAFMLSSSGGFASLEEAAAALRVYNPRRAPKHQQGLMRSLRERGGRLYWHWDPAIVGAAPSESLASMLSERLADLPMSLPLLLVSGAESDVVDADAIEAFRRQAPQAEIVALPRAGHMVVGDRNDLFAEAITRFLASAAVRP